MAKNGSKAGARGAATAAAKPVAANVLQQNVASKSETNVPNPILAAPKAQQPLPPFASADAKPGTAKFEAPKMEAAPAAKALASAAEAAKAAPVVEPKPVQQPIAAKAPKPRAAAAVKPQAAVTPAQATPSSDAARPEIQNVPTSTSNKGTQNMNEQINKAADQAKNAMNANMEATRETADRVQAAFGDVQERTKGMMEKNAQIVQEMADLGRGNVEAVVASSRAAARGFEALSREAADFGRRSFEEASTALKSFSEVRSPADLFRLQSEYVRGAFDSLVSESSKVSEQMIKVSGEVAEPITNRYAAAAERVKSFAA
jgi:phasin family protein